MPIDIFDQNFQDSSETKQQTVDVVQLSLQTQKQNINHQYEFENLGISFELSQVLEAHSITKPTLIQQLSIKQINLHSSLIVSPTASGKTLCFVLPSLQHLTQNPQPFHSIFLAPTRELAQQIFDQVSCYSRTFGLQPCLITGGQSISLQTGQLRDGPYIIVATPGRLASIIRSIQSDISTYFENNQFLVLDEADFFFTDDTQFNDDLTTIIQHLPKTKKVVLATASNNFLLNQFAELHQYQKIISPSFRIPQNILQHFKIVPQDFQASSYLAFFLSILTGIDVANKNDGKPQNKNVLNTKIRQGIVFAESGEQAEIYNRLLNQLNFKSVALHGKMKQDDRFLSIQQFRLGQALILVATDLASRGLDIPKVDFIFQMNIPKSDTYLHRIGRVGRSGQNGTSMIFMKANEFLFKDNIEADHNITIPELINFNNWCWNGKIDNFNEDWLIREVFPKVSKAELTAKMDIQMENIGERINRKKSFYK
ncbi:ATP-dependent RNA helicase [Spironucleus salmonicida]|uniref:ATP-dependent RNA helicase n=1 Tax=Spironucleus salmonicida TaxID=348837 RepID=V6LRG6_9EUKA|nr:ATP-dependent RNA helicase [Spironucleus salmonicida]|eukprot:EST47247.1 ATP-dependent RNA helicase [Spironucleus salmonicida]